MFMREQKKHSSSAFSGNRNFLYGGVAILMLIVIIAALASLMQLLQQAEQRAASSTQNLAKSIEQTVTGLIDTIDIALLASANEISQQMSTETINGSAITNMLIEHQKHIPSVAYFRATNEHGNIIYGPNTPSPPVNTADRDHFIQLRESPQATLAIDKPFWGRISQKWVWTFARRINKPDNSFGGVIFAAISIDEINKMLAEIKLATGRSISLRAADLSLIARYPTSSLTYFPIGEKNSSTEFLKALKHNPDEGTYASGASSVDGIERTYSYHRNAKYGFIVNVGIDNETAFAGWRRQAWVIGVLVTFFILALLAFSRFACRWWQRQEDAMTSLEEAQSIAHVGQYNINLRTGRWTSSAILDDILGIDSNYPRDLEHWQKLTAPDLRKKKQAYMEKIVEQRLSFDSEYRIIRPCDGSERWVLSKGKLQFDVEEKPLSLVGTIQDITKQKQTESDLRIAASAFESQEAMVITDANTIILRVNRAFTENTGYSSEDVVGRTPRLLKSGRHDADFFRNMWKSISNEGGWQGEIWDRRKNGEEYQKWLTTSAVKDATGKVTNYIGTQYDITERKLAEARINELAFFDQLTGLPNRTLMHDRLRQAMKASERSGTYGALMLIDLDNFKTLNDTLGHDMGDLLLKQVAQRLTACLRAGDTVARLGGDEFVLMLASLSANEKDAATRVELIGEKILAQLNQTYQLKDVTYLCTASIGASLFTGQKTEVDVLLKQSDIALYKSKDAGRNALRFFDANMEIVVMKRAAMERDLREAIQDQQFVLHYQPQIADGMLTGAEVLVRWLHPQRGLISPAEFIPLAEETGLILPLGLWVLEGACKQLTAWETQADMADFTIAVNVSAQQFRHVNFVNQVVSVLNSTGANPLRLKLELTESTLASNIDEIIEKMFLLKDIGVSFSLDDFGTGYSSLSYLKLLPLDQLKIDQSFVRDVLIDPNDASIAKTIITLGKSLGLNVIAEGVETSAQRDFLISLGCHAFQGYFFSRPLPVEGFEQYVKQF